MTPQPFTTSHALHSSQGGVMGANSFIIPPFSVKREAPLSAFYFKPAPISWNTPQKHVQGFELSPLFPKLIATFRLLWCRALWLCERARLGFFYCAIIPQVPQRPGDDTWREYMINCKELSRSRKHVHRSVAVIHSGVYLCLWAGKIWFMHANKMAAF